MDSNQKPQSIYFSQEEKNPKLPFETINCVVGVKWYMGF
jgi:hypothetical protein